MNPFRKLWDLVFPPIQPIPPGTYSYQAPADAPFPYRLHLRIEPDGQGILIVNASTVVHLNATAAEYAYFLVKDTPEDEAVNLISRRYDAAKEVIRRDYLDLHDRLKTLIETPDLDPVTYLDFDRREPYSGAQLAPYRIDCALTYHLPDAGKQAITPQERVTRELLNEEWQQILSKAWNAGVPHAVFTGGEPTLRPDLVELVTYAEKLGMVTGLMTDGLRLAEPAYLHQLLQAGLDHLTILLDPTDEGGWEAIRDSLAEDIALTVHLTLSERLLPNFGQVLDRLAQMGVLNLSLSAESLALTSALQEKRQDIANRQMRLIWDLPVPYSHFHPVALELAETMPNGETAAGPGTAWLYVEPDGDVLRGQGYYQEVLGNLLADPWEKVWEAAKREPARVS